MSTIIEALQKGNVPSHIPLLSEAESIRPSQFIQNIIKGHVVVPRNNRHGALTPVAIGKDTRVKINANIGTSPASCDFENEIQKLKAAISAGADAVMDLSIAGNSSAFRKRIIDEFDITLGTVPIYDAMIGLDSTDKLNFSHFLRQRDCTGAVICNNLYTTPQTYAPLLPMRSPVCTQNRGLAHQHWHR